MPDDPTARVNWTIAEAAAWLDPPIPEPNLRAIVLALRIRQQRTTMPQDKPGRPVTRYDVNEIILLHRALLPWILAMQPRDATR